LHEFSWDGKSSLFTRDEQGIFKPLDISAITDASRREERLSRAYVRCPNPKEDPPEDTPPEHHLPIDYMRYQEPLVIGFIGAVESGKSTLLAMMIDQLDGNKLLRYGFAVQPLVQEDHERFRDEHLRKLLRGETLDRTRAAQESTIEFTDGFLLVHGDDIKKPVVFFDVGGEALGRVGTVRNPANNRATRFLQAVSALIFVVDPEHLIGPGGPGADAMGRPAGDDTFRRVLGDIRRSSGQPAQYLDIPAAIVLGKADLLRLDPVIARWLNAADYGSAVDPLQIRAESKDVYAFLHQHQGESWLLPFDGFKHCTLHVVSATGSKASKERYSQRLRPRRVLQPLIAILAMTGVLNSPGAAEVGQ
jgi:hypothetical protein